MEAKREVFQYSRYKIFPTNVLRIKYTSFDGISVAEADFINEL